MALGADETSHRAHANSKPGFTTLRGQTRNMKTLFLQAPSYDGFDGGAGSRYQAKREIRSF
ncbi:hypothetical protein C7413_115172, partial [Paraburkholderia silvatlantica]